MLLKPKEVGEPMCTIGCAHLNNVYIFKNRDPIRGTPMDEWVEKISIDSSDLLIIKNHRGCYGGLSSFGVGLVGTFVNMVDGQKNYFDGDCVIEILRRGKIKEVQAFLSHNPERLYGNVICSDGNETYSFEMNGDEVDSVKITDRYLMTNHFQRIQKTIRTISDPFIRQWTHSRLERGRQLLASVSNIENIKQLLSDHEGYPDFSICNHGKIPTASSYIIDCSEKTIFYCTGAPCEHEYVAYTLL